MHSRRMLTVVAVMTITAGALIAWGVHASAIPGDRRVTARVGLVIAATVVVTGTLVICGTSRMWFRGSRRRR